MNDKKSAIPNSEGFKLRIRFADGGIADTKAIEHERSKAELNAPRLLEACKAAQRSIITANEMLFDRIKWEFEGRLHQEARNLMNSINMGRTCSLDEFILDVEMAEDEKVKCQGLLESFDAIDDDINSLPEMMELSSQIVLLEDAILNRD